MKKGIDFDIAEIMLNDQLEEGKLAECIKLSDRFLDTLLLFEKLLPQEIQETFKDSVFRYCICKNEAIEMAYKIGFEDGLKVVKSVDTIQ